MMKELNKYSNASLANIAGLPIGMIRGFRKNIFTDAMMRGLKSTILKSIKGYENGKRK